MTCLSMMMKLLLMMMWLTSALGLTTDTIQLVSPSSLVHLTFDVLPSQLPNDATRHTVRFAFPGSIKDRWGPQVGPLTTVPKDCIPTANMSTCFGGAHRFATLLQQDREIVSAQNESVLFFVVGSFLSSNSFGRIGRGSLSAKYLYLMGCDAIGISEYEFHPELGGNYTVFVDTYQQCLRGKYVSGGQGDSNKWFNDPTNVYHTKSNTPPLLQTCHRLRRFGYNASLTSASAWSILSTPDETIPDTYGSYILDYGLDTQAIVDGQCLLNASSCTNSATTLYGASRHLPLAQTTVSSKRLGLLTWDSNLLETTRLDAVFPNLIDRLYYDSDLMHELQLIQKEVSILIDSGVNQIILLTTTEMNQQSVEFFLGISGIDVVISSPNIVYPSYFNRTSITGSPIIFLACSEFMLHYCLAEIQFDAFGNVRDVRFNTTILDGQINTKNSTLTSVLTSDSLNIYQSAVTTMATTKLYDPTYPPSPDDTVRFFETDDGNMAADSGRWIGGSEIGLCNSGAIRSILPKGVITVNDLRSFMPFESSWMTLNVTGSLLWSSLENSVSWAAISNSSAPGYSSLQTGRFLQVSGMRMAFNPKLPSVLEPRVLYVEILQPTTIPVTSIKTVEAQGFNLDSHLVGNNNTVEEAEISFSLKYVRLDPYGYYTITIPSFEYKNGDGYSFLGNPEATLLAEASTFRVTLSSYLNSQRNFISKVSAEGRIIVDANRFPPIVLSVEPNTVGIITNTPIIIQGRDLYVGSSLTETAITFKSRNGLVVTCAHLTIAMIPNLPTGQQAVACERSTAELMEHSSIKMRIFVNSGSLGAETFTSEEMITFTSGSLSEVCGNSPETIFTKNQCVCRAGYYAIPSACNNNGNCQPRCLSCPTGTSKNFDGNDVCQPYPITTVDTGVRDAVFAVTGVSFILILVNMVILLWKWDHSVFKAASRSFMLLILFLQVAMSTGALIYATIPDLQNTSGKVICISRAWLTCLPLSGILAIMLAKNRRMWAIFGATKLHVQVHTDADLLVTTLLICSIQTALLIIFSALPLSRPTLTFGGGTGNESTHHACSQETGFMPWLGAEVVFFSALMVPSAYLGFKTRNLLSQYNESSHLQNALLVLMFFGVIIVPLDISIQTSPEASLILQGLGQSFLSILLTCIIFGPKLYYVLNSSFSGRAATSAYGSALDPAKRSSSLWKKSGGSEGQAVNDTTVNTNKQSSGGREGKSIAPIITPRPLSTHRTLPSPQRRTVAPMTTVVLSITTDERRGSFEVASQQTPQTGSIPDVSIETETQPSPHITNELKQSPVSIHLHTTSIQDQPPSPLTSDFHLDEEIVSPTQIYITPHTTE